MIDQYKFLKNFKNKYLEKNAERKMNSPTSLSTLNSANNQKNDNRLNSSRTLLTEVDT